MGHRNIFLSIWCSPMVYNFSWIVFYSCFIQWRFSKVSISLCKEFRLNDQLLSLNFSMICRSLFSVNTWRHYWSKRLRLSYIGTYIISSSISSAKCKLTRGEFNSSVVVVVAGVAAIFSVVLLDWRWLWFKSFTFKLIFKGDRIRLDI